MTTNTPKLPTVDILVNSNGKELQHVVIVNTNELLGSNSKVKCLGNGGVYKNPTYKGIEGQVENFDKILWVKV